MTARNYICTYNLSDDQVPIWNQILERFHKESKARYTCGQLEKGELTEHPHIQFYMNYKNSVRFGTIKKIDGTVHIEKANEPQKAMEYCMKQETRVEGPLEFGTKPFKVNSKTDWEEIRKLAKEGQLEKIPASIYVCHYNTLKAIAKDNMKFKDADHLRGIWIYGKAGAGKSRYVRDESERLGLKLYPKLCNKWWDGYQGEPLVVMDDMMPAHNVLSQQLKIWSDRYDCILETKGGAVHSKYEYFVVTSQYKIDEVFEDPKDREAIHRRFTELEISSILSLKLSLDSLIKK